MAESSRLLRTVVVVDILSFSTAVSVAADSGVIVHPYRRSDHYAPRVAQKLGARLAGRRGSTPSLSPHTLAQLAPGERVLLASEGGSGLSLTAAARGAVVVAGCLRNAGAVGRWLRSREQPALVVAAGKRWRDGTFRVAVEDLIGAGAIIAASQAGGLTPEAEAAVAAYRAATADLQQALAGCTTGTELITGGFAVDVEWAAEADVSHAVPVLRDGAFRPDPRAPDDL